MVIRVMKGKPSCFSTQEKYDDWCEAAVVLQLVLPGNVGSFNYCKDCTPEYKAECIEKKVCDHPETFFYTSKDANGDDEITGVSYDSLFTLMSVKTWRDAKVKYCEKYLRYNKQGVLVD